MSDRTLFILLFLLPGGSVIAPLGLWLIRKRRAAKAAAQTGGVINDMSTTELNKGPAGFSATTIMEYEHGVMTHEQIAKLLEIKGKTEVATDLRRTSRKFSLFGLAAAALLLSLLLAVWVGTPH